MILNHHHVLCVEVRGVKEVPIKRTIVNCIINKYDGVCIKIHPSSDPNLLFASLVPHLLYFLNQMLAVILLSQHLVSSSKTIRPRAPCGACCIRHAVRTWSAVCSEAPHSQFGEGARPHLCIDKWNRPTPARRWLSLTRAARGKPIPTGLAPVSGTKTQSLEAFSIIEYV